MGRQRILKSIFKTISKKSTSSGKSDSSHISASHKFKKSIRFLLCSDDGGNLIIVSK